MNRTRNKQTHERIMQNPSMELLKQLYGQGNYAQEYAQAAIDDSREQCAPDDRELPIDMG